jgi:hypothetical protein
MLGVNTIFFIATWWLNDIGLLWFIIWSYWIGLDSQLKGYTSIILYTRLTHRNLFIVPQNFHFVATIMVHIILFFIYWGVYNLNKKKIILFGTLLISVIPNYYNPYEINNIRLGIRLVLYCFITSRLKKQAGLLMSKYLSYAWILVTHEATWVFIPFQIVYDTYKYKIITTV